MWLFVALPRDAAAPRPLVRASEWPHNPEKPTPPRATSSRRSNARGQARTAGGGGAATPAAAPKVGLVSRKAAGGRSADVWGDPKRAVRRR